MGKLIEYDYLIYLLCEKNNSIGLTPKEIKQYNKLMEWYNNTDNEE